MVLVDTSVWIDFLRSGNELLQDLLNDNEVATHPLVIGELHIGNISKRNIFLSDTGAVNRDVFFIQTVQAGNGRVMVYRNEDTGWGWPPYFKFDTANLQAEASDLKSTADAPKWAMIRHYGWRNEFLSIYPNAVEVWSVDGPDAPKGIPWLNIVIIVCFLAVLGLIWRMWRRFRQRRIDPVVDDISETWDAAGDAVTERRGRFSKWLDTWRAKENRRN